MLPAIFLRWHGSDKRLLLEDTTRIDLQSVEEIIFIQKVIEMHILKKRLLLPKHQKPLQNCGKMP
jgi:hypothetical protein